VPTVTVLVIVGGVVGFLIMADREGDLVGARRLEDPVLLRAFENGAVGHGPRPPRRATGCLLEEVDHLARLGRLGLPPEVRRQRALDEDRLLDPVRRPVAGSGDDEFDLVFAAVGERNARVGDVGERRAVDLPHPLVDPPGALVLEEDLLTDLGVDRRPAEVGDHGRVPVHTATSSRWYTVP
jgi:hypothetical protein